MSRYVLVLAMIAAAVAHARADEPKPAAKPAAKPADTKPQPAADSPAAKPAAKAAKKDDAKADAAKKAAEQAGEKAKVTVESVSGRAQKLPAGKGKKWLPLKKGDVLDEMTIIRTGLGAKVTLKFADRGEVVLSGACKMGVREFRKKGNHARMRLGLKYGTIRASIEKHRGSTDWKVATPVATLAVGGSQSRFALLMDNPNPLKVYVRSGKWDMKSDSRQRTAGPGESTDSKGTRNYKKVAGARSVGMGDNSGGLTPLEQDNLDNNGGGRGIFSYTGSNPGILIGPKQPTPPVAPPSENGHSEEG